MGNFKIFTESKADIKFLKDYTQEILNIELDSSYFDWLGSWSGYKAGGSVSAAIRQNHDNGKETILIVDADADFTTRLNEIQADFAAYKIPVKTFLFPNNQANGNLESLLTEIALKKDIIHCFTRFEECVAKYPIPLYKPRIYAYLDIMLHPDQIVNKIDLRREEFRNYRNKAHWDLAHDYTIPLKTFLQPFFTT